MTRTALVVAGIYSQEDKVRLSLVPMAEGIAASVVAALMFCAWIAIGSIFLGRREADDELAAPGAILIGSGLTTFVLALFAAVGLVRSGVFLVAIAGVIVMLLRFRVVIRILRGVVEPFIGLTRRLPLSVAGVVIGATMWIAAIAPPRSADAMRYHLAHIRQIVSDGRWESISDYHYALPFGWSLSYLPFELLHLPQGAQLLGVFLFVVFVSSAVRGLMRFSASDTSIVVALLLMLHPASLRLFTEANADAYALFVILVIALLLIRHWRFDSSDIGLLGFVSWIGLQSRYQLAAIAVAATVCLVLAFRQHPARAGAAIAYFAGAVPALLLASPFYVMNEISFGNPVWPLLIDPQAAGTTYNDIVAYTYSRSLIGTFKPGDVAESVATLFTTTFLFPLQILIPLVIVAGAFVRHTGGRLLGVFGLIFLIEWFVMQPLLYPRFILMMLPVALICGALLLARLLGERPFLKRPFSVIGVAGALALAVAAPLVSRDNFAYAMSGDRREYHRFTWFHRLYDWVNKNTPANARFLVIVSSGHTYYLDRPYRRADPWISGVVDWPRTNTGARLDSVLAAGNYSYVLYENRDWSRYPGGESTMNAVADGLRAGLLTKVIFFEDTLYTSRFRRSYRTTRVHVLKRTALSADREVQAASGLQ